MSEGYVRDHRYYSAKIPVAFFFSQLSHLVLFCFSSDALDELQLKRYCCRRMVLTHVDLIEKLLHYNRACLLLLYKKKLESTAIPTILTDCFFSLSASHGENEGTGSIRTTAVVEALAFPCSVCYCQQVPSLPLNQRILRSIVCFSRLSTTE